MHQFRCNSPRQNSINLWKVVGALVRPKGMHSHSQKPKGPIVKVVRGIVSSPNSTCQYPDFRSSVESHTAPCKQSRVSSILGSEYPSFTILLLSSHRLIQNISPPSCFSDKHHSTGPGAEVSSNCTHLNHLLEVSLHLLIEVRWYPSVPFFTWLGVCNFDGMFNDVAFAKV